MLHGLVPFVNVLSHGRFHAIGVVIPRLGPRAHVLLMGLGVEEMRKEPFLAFRQIEGGGKRGEAKGRKHKLSLNVNRPALTLIRWW